MENTYLFDVTDRLSKKPQRPVILPDNDFHECIIYGKTMCPHILPRIISQAIQNFLFHVNVGRVVVEMIEANHHARYLTALAAFGPQDAE